MTSPKKDSTEPKQNEELDLQKKTLKDLPESGEDVKGGRVTRQPTIVSTIIC